MAIANKFNVYFKDRPLKSNCVLEAMIPAGHTLTDDEVRKWFKIDEDHREWERAHRPSRVNRYVFDKCIVPDNPCTRIESSYGGED